MNTFDVSGSVVSCDSIEQKHWSNSSEDGPVRLSWSNSRKLEILSIGRQSVFPTLEYASSVSPDIKGKPIIVVGEPGAGISSFVSYHKHLGFATYNFALKQQSLGDLDPNKPTIISNVEKGVSITNHLLAMKEGFEKDKVLTTGLYLVTRDPYVQISGPYSEFSDICTVSRIARFNTEEIVAILRTKFGNDSDEKLYTVAETIIEWTGGQPLLVNTVISSMQTLELGVSIRNRVRDNPPPVVTKWQVVLAELILASNESATTTSFLNSLRDFCKDVGCPFSQASPYLVPLVLSGWLSASEQSWRFSFLHQFWALPVLRSPKSFLIRNRSK